MSETEVSRMKSSLVPLATLIGRELRNEKVEKPYIKYGQAALAKKGEDYFLIKTDCQRVPGNPSTSFSVFAVNIFSLVVFMSSFQLLTYVRLLTILREREENASGIVVLFFFFVLTKELVSEYLLKTACFQRSLVVFCVSSQIMFKQMSEHRPFHSPNPLDNL